MAPEMEAEVARFDDTIAAAMLEQIVALESRRTNATAEKVRRIVKTQIQRASTNAALVKKVQAQSDTAKLAVSDGHLQWMIELNTVLRAMTARAVTGRSIRSVQGIMNFKRQDRLLILVDDPSEPMALAWGKVRNRLDHQEDRTTDNGQG